MKWVLYATLICVALGTSGCIPQRLRGSSAVPARVETRTETKERLAREIKRIGKDIAAFAKKVEAAIRNNAKPEEWIFHALHAAALGLRLDSIQEEVDRHQLRSEEWDEWLSAAISALAESTNKSSTQYQ